MSDSLWTHGLQHIRLPCPSLSPGAGSNSRPSSQWCHSTVSSFVCPFSCPQSFPASGSFPVLYKEVENHKFGICEGSWNQYPVDTEGWLYLRNPPKSNLHAMYYSFSIFALLTFWTVSFFVMRGCSMSCRILKSTPGLYLLDTSSTHFPKWQSKTFPDCVKHP